MRDRVFYDTNIIVYLYDETEVLKQEITHKSFALIQPVISTQVLNEMSNVMLKKYSVNISTINTIIDNLRDFTDIVIIDILHIKNALEIMEKYQLSFYDSLIIASALEAKCKILYTEDMQHGLRIKDELTIINPYKKQINETICSDPKLL
jgi:predicted nucleic acid-binding protein